MSTMTEDVPRWTVTDRLRKAREVRGYKQDELAAELGLTRRTVGALERGESPIKRSHVLAWAMATGVPAEWIEGGELPRLDSNQQPADNRARGRLDLELVA